MEGWTILLTSVSQSFTKTNLTAHLFMEVYSVYSVFVTYFLLPNGKISDVGSGKTNWSVAHADHSIHLQVIGCAWQLRF